MPEHKWRIVVEGSRRGRGPQTFCCRTLQEARRRQSLIGGSIQLFFDGEWCSYYGLKATRGKPLPSAKREELVITSINESDIFDVGEEMEEAEL